MHAPLPHSDGIGPSSVYLPPGPWATVLEFLTRRFVHTDEATWLARLQSGLVVDERGNRLAPHSAYRPGLRIYYYRSLANEPVIPFSETILHCDEHLLVVDKPHFLPVMPAGRFLRETLLVRLKRRLALDFLVPIHRLDRETAGVVLFSVTPQTRAVYHSLFERRAIEKTYEALAPLATRVALPATRRSRLAAGEPFFRMAETAGEPNAETHIELIEARAGIGRYRLRPVTGRKHQLRVHMAALGVPILNDPLYPQLVARDPADFSQPLQLIARRLAFTDPVTGAPRQFESRLSVSTRPDDST